MEITKVVQLLEYAVLLIPFLLVLIGLFVYSKQTNLRLNFKDIFKRLISGALGIVLLMVVLTGSYLAISFAQSKLTGNIVIGFNFAEASRGLNPNNTRFNTYDIISDDVLETAIERGGFTDLTPAQLRATLSVVPVESGSTISVEQYYVSSEYALIYTGNKNTTKYSANDVLTAVAASYYDSFCEDYLRKTNVLALDFSKMDSLDYLDRIDLLGKYVSDVAEYLSMCNAESNTYVNEEGETFATLAAKVRNLGDVELEKIRSYVLTNGLSADAQRQISRLEYENLVKDINYEKNVAQYEINLEVIRMYERDMATIVLVPTRDETGEFYMGRTKVSVDNFANSAQQASSRAAQTNDTIKNNSYAIEQISNTKSGSSDFAIADEMLVDLQKNLNAFAEKACAMVEDYDTGAKKGSVTVGMSNLDWLDRGFIIKLAILVAFFFGCSAVFVIGIGNKSGKNEKKASGKRAKTPASEA